MDRMLYVAMTGAKQTMLAQSVNANNLANVSTSGFQAHLNDMHPLALKGPGVPSRVFVEAGALGVDRAQGSLNNTGNDLDVAIVGDGYLAVQSPDGTEAYTRAGNLTVSNTGLLSTGAGYPVLGNGGPITIPDYEKLEIGDDGTISVQGIGQELTTLAVVDRIKLVNPKEPLQTNEYGLLSPFNGTVAPANAEVSLRSGVLESSNVNAVESMIQMVSMARQFEMQIKLIKTAQENSASGAQLMRLS